MHFAGWLRFEGLFHPRSAIILRNGGRYVALVSDGAVVVRGGRIEDRPQQVIFILH